MWIPPSGTSPELSVRSAVGAPMCMRCSTGSQSLMRSTAFAVMRCSSGEADDSTRTVGCLVHRGILGVRCQVQHSGPHGPPPAWSFR